MLNHSMELKNSTKAWQKSAINLGVVAFMSVMVGCSDSDDSSAVTEPPVAGPSQADKVRTAIAG